MPLRRKARRRRISRIPGSFRDPSGHLFRRDGVLLRAVNAVYASHWEKLQSSGLMAELQKIARVLKKQDASAPHASPIR